MRAVILNRVAVALASIGVFIAGTLTLAELTERDVPCGGGSGCAIVAADSSSHLFGIPTAAFGLVAYFALSLLSLWRLLAAQKQFQEPLGIGLTSLGTMASAGLTSYSLFSLHTTCIWCLGSAITMVLSLGIQLVLPRAKPEISRKPLLDGLLVGSLTVTALVAVFLQARYLHRDQSLAMTRSLARQIDPDLLVPANAHVRGAQLAPDVPTITLVEFADFACPACRALQPKLERLVNDSAGRLRIVFHSLPLQKLAGHEDSLQAAVYGELAAQADKFWDFADAVYAKPKTPTLSEYESILTTVIGGFAGDRKLAESQVATDLALAKRLHIAQTPTFIIEATGQPVDVATSLTLKDVLSEPAYTKILTGR